MSILPKKVFKPYDIRGNAEESLTAVGFYVLGIALCKYAKYAKSFVVGMDTRSTSNTLVQALMSGLQDGGGDVSWLGGASTPFALYSLRVLQKDFALIVTASHNPWCDNGLKIYHLNFEDELIPICGEELLKIYDLQQDIQCKQHAFKITAQKSTLLQSYWDFCLGDVDCSKSLWNVNYGATELPFGVCNQFSADVNPAPLLPQGPDPMNPVNQKDIAAKANEDIVFSFDGDGDRVQVMLKMEAEYYPVPSECLGLFFCLLNNRAKIIFDVHVSRKLIDYLERQGCEVIVSKVGHSHIQLLMRAVDADYGIEVSGHFFFRECLGGDDALLLAGMIMKNMDLFDECVKRYRALKIHKSAVKRVNIDNVLAKIQSLERKYRDKTIDKSDGIKILFEDAFGWGWVLFRASNTQACISCMCEGSDEIFYDKMLNIMENEL